MEHIQSEPVVQAWTKHLNRILGNDWPSGDLTHEAAIGKLRGLRAQKLLEMGFPDLVVAELAAAQFEASAGLPPLLQGLMNDARIQQVLLQFFEQTQKCMSFERYPFLMTRLPIDEMRKCPHLRKMPIAEPIEASCSADCSRGTSSSGGDTSSGWPAPRYVSWLCGRSCPVIDCSSAGGALPKEAVNRVSQNIPAILRGLKLFPAACDHWSFSFFADNLLGKQSVFTSENNQFSYWYGKANSAKFAFKPPTQRQTMTFREFLSQRDRSENSHQSLYFQEAVYKEHVARKDPLVREAMSAEMQRDWDEGLSKEILDQVQKLCGADSLNTSSLFCSGEGAYSRPHFDQNPNLFLQVRGAKRWLLFPPEDSPLLYPYPKGHPLDRKSRVDFEAPQVDMLPKAADLKGRGIVAEIGPGDVLWLPSHWWHAVQSLEPETLSVNFWFGGHSDVRRIPPELAIMECSRDLETLLQATIGPPAVEQFLRALRQADLPRSRVECWLRCAIFGMLADQRRTGRLLNFAEVRQVLQLLDPDRYSGLQFDSTEAAAPVPQADRNCAADGKRAGCASASRFSTAGAKHLAHRHAQAWCAGENCRAVRGAARSGIAHRRRAGGC